MNRPVYHYTDDANQTIEFTIPEPHTKICCNLSGGADSAILAYMVIDYCTKHIPDAELHFITIANPIKGWYHGAWANKVVDTLLKETKTTLIKSHTVFFRDNQRREEITEIEDQYFADGKATLFFNAVTQNPPLEITELLEGRVEFRDPGKHRGLTNTGDGWMRIRPFGNTDKRMVSYMYHYHHMEELLYPNTRSCEMLTKDGSDSVSHCGECWWCKERNWAFGRL